MRSPPCPVVVQCLSKEASAPESRLSNLCPKSVRCRHGRSRTAADRRARASHRRRDGAPARVGAALRPVHAGPHRRRLPALLGGRRPAGATDAGAARERGSRRPRRPGRPRSEPPALAEVAPAAAVGGAPPRPRAARRRRRSCRVRPPARRLLHESRARRRRPAAPARARCGVGARRDLRRAGALRLEPAPRSPARPCARLGPRLGPDARCSPVRRASGTIWGSSSSVSHCGSSAGGSRSSAPTRRPTRSSRQWSGSSRRRSSSPSPTPRGSRVWQTPSVASARTPARPSGSAARERGHVDGALVLEGSALEAAEQVSR